MSTDESLRAHHEAAHAVANTYFSVPFDSTSLATPLEYQSLVKEILGSKYETGFKSDEQDDPEYILAKGKIARVCVAILAGPLIEKQFASKTKNTESEDDIKIAAIIAKAISLDNGVAADYLAEREGEARLVIGMFAKEIDSLAAELLKGNTIQKKDIKVMLNRD